MSEFQYYEFQAVDRPLTRPEMAELRKYSTRARITPTSFVNDYQWGNFKGNQDAWMERYFDAFLYLANWGTRILSFRLSADSVKATAVPAYCHGGSAATRKRGGQVVLTFISETDEGDELCETEGRLSSVISIRSELARGDVRALYLGWLLRLQLGELGDDDLEPPSPGRAGKVERRPACHGRVPADRRGIACDGGGAQPAGDTSIAQARRYRPARPRAPAEGKGEGPGGLHRWQALRSATLAG
jgi:hypothetical protein